MPRIFIGILFSLISLLPLSWRETSLQVSTRFPLILSQTQEPVVRAVLFWMRGCPNCTEVIEGYLPEVQAQFGRQLDIRLVEVVTTEDVDRLFRVGSAYGLSKEKTGVPLLIIGDDALAGAQAISTDLSRLVKEYLRSGGVDYPDLENLPNASETSMVDQDYPSAEEPTSNGMNLAAVIMIGMLVSLAITGWVVARAFQGGALAAPPGWFSLMIPVIALIGLGVSIYLAVIEATSIPAICGPIGDCNTVQQSPYAKVFGIIPVGLMGVLGYLGILAAWFWGKFGSGKLASFIPLAIFAMGIFGTLYSVYLTYLELFVIKAVCVWCLTSAVIMTALMLLSLPAASQWLAAAEEDEQ